MKVSKMKKRWEDPAYKKRLKIALKKSWENPKRKEQLLKYTKFKIGHPFFKGGEKSWFKKGHLQFNTGKTHFKKGMIPWNKNKKCPSISKTLKKVRKEKGERFKNSGFQKAEKHWNWKNGVSPQNKLLRNSKDFRHWREKVFEYDDYTCWVCGEKGGKLHPHHLKRFADYPKLRFVVNNGLTLCEFCHRTYTKFGIG